MAAAQRFAAPRLDRTPRPFVAYLRVTNLLAFLLLCAACQHHAAIAPIHVVRRPDPVTIPVADARPAAPQVPQCEPAAGELAETSPNWPPVRNELTHCYHDFLTADPTVGGAMTLTFGVDTCGNTIAPHAEGIATVLETCVERSMAHWRFRDFAPGPRFSLRVFMTPH